MPKAQGKKRKKEQVTINWADADILFPPLSTHIREMCNNIDAFRYVIKPRTYPVYTAKKTKKKKDKKAAMKKEKKKKVAMKKTKKKDKKEKKKKDNKSIKTVMKATRTIGG